MRPSPAVGQIGVMSLALFTLCSALVAQASTGLDEPGPFAVMSQTSMVFPIPSGDVEGRLFWPVSPNLPAPILVVAHGFARNASAVEGWGEHLASYGFVVIVPSFPSPLAPNHEANGQRILELIDYARSQLSPTGTQLDPRAGVVGHSAGGLSSFLAAAAAQPQLTAVVGLDPVDVNNLGTNAAPAITSPTLVLGAEASDCNAQGSAAALYGSLTAPGSWFLRVVGANHCDAEDPSNGACTVFCGMVDEARRATFRRYATAHLLAQFSCEALDHLPGGPALSADIARGTVTGLAVLAPGMGCIPSYDGGVAPEDAGVVVEPDDAGPSRDAGRRDGGTRRDGQAEEPDARPPADAGDLPAPTDAGPAPEDGASPTEDAAAGAADAGAPRADGSADTRIAPDEIEEGCGCTSVPGVSSGGGGVASGAGARGPRGRSEAGWPPVLWAIAGATLMLARRGHSAGPRSSFTNRG